MRCVHIVVGDSKISCQAMEVSVQSLARGGEAYYHLGSLMLTSVLCRDERACLDGAVNFGLKVGSSRYARLTFIECG